MKRKHSMPFGAEYQEDGGVRFRIWAPKAERVDVWFPTKRADSAHALSAVNDGWFESVVADTPPGTEYQYQIDGGLKVPDPASRCQAGDVHGPSQVVDPSAFDWQDGEWRGRPWEEAVIYELHVGTFTPQGSFTAVEQKLEHLVDTGITVIELMPVADFPGNRGWGYDGVLPFSPDSCYGSPDDLKHLIQSAHAKGLMVFLDVVYNHFGPDGNYLRAYSPEFFTSRHHTPWGDAVNFDDSGSAVVREFFIHNAIYWLEEYHFDGLRLDAVHTILDDSEMHFLMELAERVRNTFGKKRLVHLVLENGANIASYLRRDASGQPLWFNAQWNDDIHHTLQVLITGEADGYYSDYAQQPLQQLGRCLTQGFAYQGDYSAYEGAARGEPSIDLPSTAFVSFLQNHDQIGNRAFGDRLVQQADALSLRAALAILLLAPSPPLLFMGEEFGATTPFLFFCDFTGDLAKAVTDGRRQEFARFTRFSSLEIPDPNAEQTFENSKLDWNQLSLPQHQEWLKLYRELLAVRRQFIVPQLPVASGHDAAFSVNEEGVLSARWKFKRNQVLSMCANLSSKGKPALSSPPEGELIYATSDDVADKLDGRQMDPWTVAWFIQS